MHLPALTQPAVKHTSTSFSVFLARAVWDAEAPFPRWTYFSSWERWLPGVTPTGAVKTAVWSIPSWDEAGDFPKLPFAEAFPGTDIGPLCVTNAFKKSKLLFHSAATRLGVQQEHNRMVKSNKSLPEPECLKSILH